MAFNMAALLTDKSPGISLDDLALRLRDYFKDLDGFSLSYEEHPFDPSIKNLVLDWGKWRMRVFYETGEEVLGDSVEISQYAETPAEKSLVSTIDRRIRIYFSDDPDREFTNHIIYMFEFLEALPGVIIFDPQKLKFGI